MAYLVEHPHPRYQQYRTDRRGESVTGAQMLHITAQAPDLDPPDSGAERVATWIATRRGLDGSAKYGSYHTIEDADSILSMAPFAYEVWGSGVKAPDGSGLRSNSILIHHAIACRHDQWETLPSWWVTAAVDNLAVACAMGSKYVEQVRGYKTPPKFITPAEMWAGQPGFIRHSDVDPGRRKDPGVKFPAAQFLDRYAELTKQATGSGPGSGLVVTAEWLENMRLIQRRLGVDDDGKYGPKTRAAFDTFAATRTEALSGLSTLSHVAAHAAARNRETAAQLNAAVRGVKARIEPLSGPNK